MTARRVERLEDPEEALLRAFAGFQAAVWTALPAIITKVDFGKMTLEAQPAIQARIRLPDGSFTWVSLPPLVDVPIVFPSGGGFLLTFPLAAGDECLVVFASRCIDAWWQSGGVQLQADLRLHDLSDGFAIPGPRSLPHVVPAVSPSDVTLRNEAGTARISIKADGGLEFTTPGQLVINAGGGVVINSNVSTVGSLTNNGKAVGSTHRHPNGNPNTGTPL